MLLNTRDQITLKLSYIIYYTMAKWKKGLKEFPVSPFYDERRGCMIVIPKPIVEALKSPGKFVFKIAGSKIVVVAGEAEK